MTESENLEERIEKWLFSQGYPLEMVTAQAFMTNGFNISSGSRYFDGEGKGAWREIDVNAYLQEDVGRRHFFRIAFYIECKSSDKPWLIFKNADCWLAPRARVVQRFANRSGDRLLSLFKDELSQNDLFLLDEPAGYSATQAFTSGKDVAWEACSSATKAARHAVSSNGQGLILVCLPIIVVDCPIFYCHLDESNDVRLNRVSKADIIWDQGSDRPFSIIKVLHRDELQAFALSATAAIEEIFALVAKDRSKVIRAVRGI